MYFILFYHNRHRITAERKFSKLKTFFFNLLNLVTRFVFEREFGVALLGVDLPFSTISGATNRLQIFNEICICIYRSPIRKNFQFIFRRCCRRRSEQLIPTTGYGQ